MVQLYWYGFTFKNTQLLIGIQRMLKQLFTALADPGFSPSLTYSPVSNMMALLINAIPLMKLSLQNKLGRQLSAMACCHLTVKAYVNFSIDYPNIIMLGMIQYYQNRLSQKEKDFEALLVWMQTSLSEDTPPDTGASKGEPRVVSPMPMVEPILAKPKQDLFEVQQGCEKAVVNRVKAKLLCHIEIISYYFKQVSLTEQRREKFLLKITNAIATLKAASTISHSMYGFLKLMIVTIICLECYHLVYLRKQLVNQFCRFLSMLYATWNSDVLKAILSK